MMLKESIASARDTVAFLAPAMSSIGQPYGHIARSVVDILKSLETGDAPQRRKVATQFVRRGSVGAVGAS